MSKANGVSLGTALAILGPIPLKYAGSLVCSSLKSGAASTGCSSISGTTPSHWLPFKLRSAMLSPCFHFKIGKYFYLVITQTPSRIRWNKLLRCDSLQYTYRAYQMLPHAEAPHGIAVCRSSSLSPYGRRSFLDVRVRIQVRPPKVMTNRVCR